MIDTLRPRRRRQDESLRRKFLCLIGYHGPLWYGDLSHVASDRTAMLERTCRHCDTVWKGRDIFTRWATHTTVKTRWTKQER